MRSLTFALALIAGASVTSALAQGALPRAGVGSSNSANQSFQQQNQMRGIQQQQQLNNNQGQLRSSTNQMNNAPRTNDRSTGARIPRRPERER